MNKLMIAASAAFAVVAGAVFADGPALPTDRPADAQDAVPGGGLSWSGAAGAWKVGDDTVIVFTDTESAGTFTVDPGKTATARVLAVGGGGPGGFTGSAGMSGGGGGAGGMLELDAKAFASGNYTITVGKGGIPVENPSFFSVNGDDTTISQGDNVLVRAFGGGGGGNAYGDYSAYNARAGHYTGEVLDYRIYEEALLNPACGRCGGSGGGGACCNHWWFDGGWGGTNTVGQGNYGGDVRGADDGGYSFFKQGGGGGGAGEKGESCEEKADPKGGAGGAGLASEITGVEVVYAGGGAGGAFSGGWNTTVLGGNGGGGSSHSRTYSDDYLRADDGVNTLGGGGAGAACHMSGKTIAPSNAGRGGSGVVVIRVTKVEDANYVAQIGEVCYKTLAAAFEDVKGQTTITLLTGVDEDIVFAPTTYEGDFDATRPFVSIDLQGYELGGSMIFTNASLGVSGGTVSAKVSISSADVGSVEKQIPAEFFPGNAKFVDAAQVDLARDAVFMNESGWSFDVDGDAIVVGASSTVTFNSGKIHAGGSAIVMAGGAVEIRGGQFVNNPEAGVALIRGADATNCKIDGGVFSEEVAGADIGEKEWMRFTDKDGNTRYCLKTPTVGSDYTVINTATGEATDYAFTDWPAAMAVIGEGGTADEFIVVQFRQITLTKDNVSKNPWGNPTYRMISNDQPQYTRLEFDDCDFDFPLTNDSGDLLNAPFGFHLYTKKVDGFGLSFINCRFSSVPYLTSSSDQGANTTAVDGLFDSCTFAADNVVGEATSKNWGDLTITNCTFNSGMLPFVPVVNVWKNSQGQPRRFSFVGNTVVFTNMAQITSRFFVTPEMGTSAAFSFGDCAIKVVDGGTTRDLGNVVIVRKGADPVVQSPSAMYTPDPTTEVVEFSVKQDLATVEILKKGETVLSALGVKGLNGLWTAVNERELAATNWPEDDLFTDEDCTQPYDKTALITTDLVLYMKAAGEDWPDPADVPENKPASDVGIDGQLANASLKALVIWAKGVGGVAFGYREFIMPEAFLLNCPNTIDAVKEARAKYKILSITFENGEWIVTVTEGGDFGPYNGETVVRRFSDVGCKTPADDGNFFRAFLEVIEVKNVGE